MGRLLDDYGPAMAMFGLQISYGGVSLITRAAVLQGMSPRVFVVYRQAIATLVIAPIAYFSRRKSDGPAMGLRSFSLIFLASLIGVTIHQNLFSEGLFLASSSMASAMINLIPAITFLMAFLIGLETINIRSFRSMAKVAGTMICVSGAISMSLLRGPKLLTAPIFGLGGEKWLLGCSILFASACCWSSWLVLQVQVTASYPDHLSLSAWMCFLATIQSALFALIVERNLNSWILHSYLEVVCCLFADLVWPYFVQAWCVARRGPVFSAMFSPLCTVFVTVLAVIFLHEEIYTGSLIGAVGVIFGLYIVLWGKASDFTKRTNDEIHSNPEIDGTKTMKDASVSERCKLDLEEPLLSNETNDIEQNK